MSVGHMLWDHCHRGYGYELLTKSSWEVKILTLVPIISIVTGMIFFKMAIDNGCPREKEDKVALGWLLVNGVMLILGLGCLLFMITNLVLLGKKLWDRSTSRGIHLQN